MELNLVHAAKQKYSDAQVWKYAKEGDLKKLLECPVRQLTMQNSAGNTPMHFLAQHGVSLIKFSVSAFKKNNKGVTPVHLLARSGFVGYRRLDPKIVKVADKKGQFPKDYYAMYVAEQEELERIKKEEAKKKREARKLEKTKEPPIQSAKPIKQEPKASKREEKLAKELPKVDKSNLPKPTTRTKEVTVKTIGFRQISEAKKAEIMKDVQRVAYQYLNNDYTGIDEKFQKQEDLSSFLDLYIGTTYNLDFMGIGYFRNRHNTGDNKCYNILPSGKATWVGKEPAPKLTNVKKEVAPRSVPMQVDKTTNELKQADVVTRKSSEDRQVNNKKSDNTKLEADEYNSIVNKLVDFAYLTIKAGNKVNKGAFTEEAKKLGVSNAETISAMWDTVVSTKFASRVDGEVVWKLTRPEPNQLKKSSESKSTDYKELLRNKDFAELLKLGETELSEVARTISGNTYLHEMARMGCEDLLGLDSKYLMLTNKNNDTVYHLLAKQGDLNVLDFPNCFNALNDNGRSVLHCLASKGEDVRESSATQAQLLVQDKGGDTVYHLLAKNRVMDKKQVIALPVKTKLILNRLGLSIEKCLTYEPKRAMTKQELYQQEYDRNPPRVNDSDEGEPYRLGNLK